MVSPVNKMSASAPSKRLKPRSSTTGATSMNKIQIIGAPFSSYVWVVRMACEEKQVPYDLVPGGMHSPEVYAIHPLGKVPVMRHGDIELCESKAIVHRQDLPRPGADSRRRARSRRS